MTREVARRPFGKTGRDVSEIGFGAWAIGGNRYGNSYGPTDDEESLRALRRARELGCTFYDTADVYGHGHSEELLGRAFGGPGARDVVLATKVGGDFYHGMPRLNFDGEYIVYALEQSLKRLRVEAVDLYQLHNPPLETVRRGEVFQVLERLKGQGKIRAYGLSIHDPKEGLAAMAVAPGLSALQVVYSVFRQEAAAELFPRAMEQGVAIIAREPLFNGLLSGKYGANAAFPAGDIRAGWPREYLRQVLSAVDRLKGEAREAGATLAQHAIRFALAHPAVAVVIPGMKTVAQVEENMAASQPAGVQ